MLADLISNEAAVLHADITTRRVGNTQAPEIQCLEKYTKSGALKQARSVKCSRMHNRVGAYTGK